MRVNLRLCTVFCTMLTSNLLFSQNYKDCITSFPVCEMRTFYFDEMASSGNPDNLSVMPCSKGFKETNSIWLKFKIAESGTLTFAISPKSEDDDLDFILLKKNSSSCENSEVIRCMAAGVNIGQITRSSNCTGQTGLNLYSMDEFEKSGCKFNSDNFLKFLDAKGQEEYVLMINNYDSRDGFSITFDGSAVLSPFYECDENALSEPITIESLYPNPATNSITLSYTSSINTSIDIAITDITGKLFERYNVNADLGINKNSFSINKLPAGTYLMKLSQNGFTTIKQFIKI